MLLGNYHLWNKNPVKPTNSYGNKGAFVNKSSSYMFYYLPDDTNTTRKISSLPTGTEPPYSLVLPHTAGEMASSLYLSGTGTVTTSLSLGKPMIVNLSGTGGMSSSMSLISSIVCILAGLGGVNGSFSAISSLLATLFGQGSIASGLSLIIPLECVFSGAGSVVANLKGNADMAAHIFVNTGQAEISEFWNYETRTLTSGALTPEQDEKLTKIKQNTDLIPPLL